MLQLRNKSIVCLPYHLAQLFRLLISMREILELVHISLKKFPWNFFIIIIFRPPWLDYTHRLFAFVLYGNDA